MSVYRNPVTNRFHIDESETVYFYWDDKSAEYRAFDGSPLGPAWDTAVRATRQLGSGKQQKVRK